MADKTIIMHKEDINNPIHPNLWNDWLETLGVDSEADHVCLTLSPMDINKKRIGEQKIREKIKSLHGCVEIINVGKEATFASSKNAKSFEKWCGENDVVCGGIMSEYKNWYLTFEVE